MAHSHPFSGGVFGQSITPYLSYLLVEAGVNDVYASGVDLFATFLRIEVSASCVYRTTLKVGNSLTDNALYEKSTATEATAETAPVVTYAEVDGSMLLTDAGWKEVKVGRIFAASDLEIVGSVPADNAPRQKITQSQYCAHLGNCDGFIEKFDTLLSSVPTLCLVFITDGAEWIRQWLLDHYATAVHILDYYHAVEHLAEVVKGTPYATTWFEAQKKILLEHSVQDVILNIKMLCGVEAEKKKQLLTYYEKNAYRMNYRYYREQGWCIGSGAIEAAHRTLIQQRMKLSGQRWSPQGAKTLLKLRVAFKSNKKQLIENIIKKVA